MRYTDEIYEHVLINYETIGWIVVTLIPVKLFFDALEQFGSDNPSVLPLLAKLAFYVVLAATLLAPLAAIVAFGQTTSTLSFAAFWYGWIAIAGAITFWAARKKR